MAKSGWFPGRCKDCGAAATRGKSRCAVHREQAREAEAARRARLKRERACTVCAAPVVVVGGRALTVCKRHREYYRVRAAAAERQ